MFLHRVCSDHKVIMPEPARSKSSARRAYRLTIEVHRTTSTRFPPPNLLPLERQAQPCPAVLEHDWAKASSRIWGEQEREPATDWHAAADKSFSWSTTERGGTGAASAAVGQGERATVPSRIAVQREGASWAEMAAPVTAGDTSECCSFASSEG